MKAEFYNKSKRSNIYGSIYVYKIVSLSVFILMSVLLSINYHRTKADFEALGVTKTPEIFYAVQVVIALFILSIITDFYIMHRTASIGRYLNKMAYIDKLTGLPNRFSCDLIFDTFNDPEKLPHTGFILLKLNNLVNINSAGGHANGNNLISDFCTIFEEVGQIYGFVGRNGGNEFVVVIDNCDSTNIDMFLMDLTKKLHDYNENNYIAPLEIAYARALNCDEHKDKITDLISLVYQRLRESPQILV
ncbi:GGDEF domain-containing protein [Butyrivibrio sp. YAB3001]|uniref:GGDEF domain-containing protein n=1 Tax=Butyrivibrio sp. YAB3001 TaxID=1520812 RepID=UPI0008F672C7|nr:GGDEF domain-containing protein [Butyrivibrio sp. YAB3001]SFB76005.1 diguanylate cyclase (GGDEF) domain-containing protein [Butyrivibrio sp. YAB3001]